jgi:hypothetical protein
MMGEGGVDDAADDQHEDSRQSREPPQHSPGSAQAAPKKRRGRPRHVGRLTRAELWEHRATDEAVFKDTQKNCGCKKKCLENARSRPGYNLMADCRDMRADLAKMEDKGRREWLRAYIENNSRQTEEGGPLIVDWKLGNGELVCISAFATRLGLPQNVIYTTLRSLNAGIREDNPDLGGRAACDDQESQKGMQVYGWIGLLKQQCQQMPNTNQFQLDWMERGELFDEFYHDQTKAGTHHTQVASRSTFDRIYNADKTIVIREFLAVNGKDHVRAFLRDAMQRTNRLHAKDRDYIRELRLKYRDSLRRERQFYWNARVLPVSEPDQHMSFIFDGATQEYCIIPRMPNFEGNKKACELKLVGCLFHGHVLLIFIVHPHLKDNANLSCHIIDKGFERVSAVRESKGQPAYAPVNVRGQLDGAAPNWNKTVFAHLDYLTAKGVFSSVKCVRNPVGNTHEDIDALFALIRNRVLKKNIFTYDEFIAEVKKAFETYGLPVEVIDVDSTYDYTEFYKDYIHADLINFGYSEWESGMHVVEIKRRPPTEGSLTEVPTSCLFRKYQQLQFWTVATKVSDLPPQMQPQPGAAFKAVGMTLNIPDDHATILTSLPPGYPVVAPRPSFDFEKVYEDARSYLPSDKKEEVQAWRRYVSAREAAATAEPRTGLPSMNRSLRPSGPDPPSAARRVDADTIIVDLPPQIGSGPGRGVLFAAQRDERRDFRIRHDHAAKITQGCHVLHCFAVDGALKFAVGTVLTVAPDQDLVSVGWRTPQFKIGEVHATGTRKFEARLPTSPASEHPPRELTFGIKLTPTGLVSNEHSGNHREFFKSSIAILAEKYAPTPVAN